MKLGEAIDLFHRRFRFTAKDDLVNFACVIIEGESVKYYVNVMDNCNVDKVQAAYSRSLQDFENVSIKIIPSSKWKHNHKFHVIWTRTGLASAPKA